jgi:hypothetical protein
VNTNAYIAACEIVGPNSPEFEAVREVQRRVCLVRVIEKLRNVLYDELNAGELEDDQYIELHDAIDSVTE